MSPWWSTTGPWSSTWALSFETFGIAFSLARGGARLRPAGGPGMRRSPHLSGGHASGELLLGQESVLHREQACRGAGRGTDLRVDVLDVVADGLRRDDQARGDLLVRHPAREQSEHLDLARGQP